MNEPFWMVWGPEHPFDETQYRTRKEAQRVARRLAAEHAVRDGSYFYVLKAQSCHQDQGRMVDFIFVPFGVGAPCPYHGPQS